MKSFAYVCRRWQKQPPSQPSPISPCGVFAGYGNGKLLSKAPHSSSASSQAHNSGLGKWFHSSKHYNCRLIKKLRYSWYMLDMLQRCSKSVHLLTCMREPSPVWKTNHQHCTTSAAQEFVPWNLWRLGTRFMYCLTVYWLDICSALLHTICSQLSSRGNDICEVHAYW